MGRQQRRPARNLVLYDSKPSKLTGEKVAHLELRFLRASAIRREGIRRVRDLIHIDPNALYSKHVKWTLAAEDYVPKAVRRAVQEDREKYRGKDVSAFLDRYRSNIAQRVRWVLERYTCAQSLKDKYPHMLMKHNQCTILHSDQSDTY